MAKGVLESAETPTDSTLVVARTSGAGEPQKHDTEVRADQGGEVAEGMRLDSHYPPGPSGHQGHLCQLGALAQAGVGQLLNLRSLSACRQE